MICHRTNGQHEIKFSNGDGSFRWIGEVRDFCWNIHFQEQRGFPDDGIYAHWADINGDLKADLICSDPHGKHSIRLSNGDGTFEDLGTVKENFCNFDWGGAARPSWADINGDGKADLVCSEKKGTHIAQLGMGDGNFEGWFEVGDTFCETYDMDTAIARTYLGDMNGDGMADLICHYDDGNIYLRLLNGQNW